MTISQVLLYAQRVRQEEDLCRMLQLAEFGARSSF